MIDIISVGAATVDIFVKSADFKVEEEKLILEHSSKNEISNSLITSGGGATNSAVSFSRLGLKSACLSLLGSDPLSNYVLQDLASNQVSTNLLIQPKTEITDFSVILVATDGGRTVLTQRGSTHLEINQIPWSKLKSTKWLYVTSLEGNLDLLEHLIGFAKDNHIKIALNPGNRELHQPAKLISLFRHLDFLLLNKTESQMITNLNSTDKNFWTTLSSYQVPVVAVTYGRQGAYVITPQEKLFSPILNTTPVDETGAGDSFGSAFVAALAHHLTPTQALEWGITNSASVVSYLGAKQGLLTIKEISSASETRKK
ncbi:MAG TPA: carbohydrate kinase family protein [Candidatus Woesebacteria bacterium]|nr:carbohydrate kinase family protein [Candidatus Woesebacteria bacterium]HPJ17437.1 carbohydrate kinase family protein [Candidatus Woesebacteria bacterium]